MTIFEQLLMFVRQQHRTVYLVGGAVRDMLLERTQYDIDVAVAGDASALARAFANEIGAAFYVMDEEHDVARVIAERNDTRYLVDFAQMRGDKIEDDLATRDFAINAMALDISHGAWSEKDLIDPFDGQLDLETRRVRAVSDDVFENDPVRLLRAARLETQLSFVLAEESVALIQREAYRLVDAPAERVRDEFYKIVAAENVMRNLKRLDDLHLLEFLLPEVTVLKGVTQSAPHIYDVFEHSLRAVGALEVMQRENYLHLAEGAFVAQLQHHFSEIVAAERTRGVLLRIALLLHDVGKLNARSVEENGRIRFFEHEDIGAEIVGRVLRRLCFSNEEILIAKTIVAEHLRPILLAMNSTISDRAVYRYFRATRESGVDIVLHAWCDQRATYGETEIFESESQLQAIIARLLDRYYHARETIVAPTLLLNGREVIETLSIEPGPRVGQLLDALREAQATGEVMTREQAIEFVKMKH